LRVGKNSGWKRWSMSASYGLAAQVSITLSAPVTATPTSVVNRSLTASHRVRVML
jgi:hypothetical protein